MFCFFLHGAHQAECLQGFWPNILKVNKLAEFTHPPKNNWQKKCVNGDDKNLRQEYVNHEIYDKMANLIKNMCYLRFKQLLNRIERK